MRKDTFPILLIADLTGVAVEDAQIAKAIVDKLY